MISRVNGHTYHTENNMTLFWDGPYSQWDESPFVFRDVEYNRAEKFMMAGKAHVFRDFESKAKIMKENNPRKQKALGKLVKNFKLDIWEGVCKDIVLLGTYLKFTQNPDHLDYLMSDPSLIIVEASPEDQIWGIGLGEDDPKAWNKETWQGKNYLGECVMDIRKYLTTGDESIKMRLESATQLLSKDI